MYIFLTRRYSYISEIDHKFFKLKEERTFQHWPKKFLDLNVIENYYYELKRKMQISRSQRLSG